MKWIRRSWLCLRSIESTIQNWWTRSAGLQIAQSPPYKRSPLRIRVILLGCGAIGVALHTIWNIYDFPCLPSNDNSCGLAAQILHLHAPSVDAHRKRRLHCALILHNWRCYLPRPNYDQPRLETLVIRWSLQAPVQSNAFFKRIGTRDIVTRSH